jgi:hypothetical protein
VHVARPEGAHSAAVGGLACGSSTEHVGNMSSQDLPNTCTSACIKTANDPLWLLHDRCASVLQPHR